MKHLLPFIFFTLFASHVIHAQNTDTAFAKQWHIIDSLIVTADKPKTALAKVNGIYREAKQKKLDPQVIRALLYRLSLQEKNTETGIDSTMNVLSKEISAATNVLQKSVLQALAAAVLHSYFNDVYWQIRHRSNTKGYTKENIETWSAADFLTAIDSLYNQALQPAGVLQQTPVEQYGAVVIDGFNTEHLRPSMYDLLANMAIEFYTNDNDKQTKLQNAFALNDTNTLAPAIVFAGTRFNTADTSSFLFKTIKLYQQIFQFHIAAGDTAALLDADINRIAWVYNNAAFSNKTVYYKKALSAVTEKYPAHPHAAQAWYLLLKLQYDGADKYNPFGDTTHHYDLVNIRQQLIQRLAIQPGESEGKANMQALLQQIDAKQLSTKAEAVNMPGTPFRVLVTYKNVDTLYGRILSKSAVANLNKSNDSAFWASLAKLPYSKYFAQPLPHVTDYRQHSVEIKMDALPAGRYVLFAASGKNFAGDSTTRLLTQDIAVSHLAYIHNGNNYYVLDREGGQPLPGVKVKAAIHYYNTNSMKWEDMLLYSGTTNKQGYFSLDSNTKKFAYGSISITLTDGADVLESTGNNTIYYNSITNAPSLAPATFEKNNARASLYTDRGIYRPGQKVLFKAIAVTKDAVTGLSKLYLAKDSLTFYLINVNEENIDSARLPVNTYGSVAGSFTLPAHGLTGSFSIAVKEIEGRQYFRVEEYKRPTFYVQLDTLGDAYRLKDTVTVTGFAQAFAGNYLNGATVKYNVTRKTRYKVYDWNYNRHPQNNNSRQIAEGAVTTGGDGRFSIQFPALADETMDSTGNPVFDFDISVSVTDAGGETREAQAAFAAGYTSAIVKLDAPAIAEKNSVPEIPVTVQNLSGKTVVALVHLKIYPLQVPGRVVRERYWERPDTYVMTEDAFIKAFPYDEYQNESNKHTWQHGAAVINDSLLTGGSTAYSMPHTQLQPGWYMIEASAKDKTGHIITDTAYTEVYDAGSNALPAKDNNFTAASKTVLHPGEEASLLVGSAYKEVYAYVKTGRFKRKAAAATGMQLIKLNDDKQAISAAVTAGDKGGLGIYYAFIKHNRYYSGGQVFNVPYDDKTLTVKYTSFRNKTEPGSKEQWTVQVTGSDSISRKAELLTTMYDASLDEFAGNTWFSPAQWPVYGGTDNWHPDALFNTESSDVSSYYDNNYYFVKIYPQLVIDGSAFVYQYRYAVKKIRGARFIKKEYEIQGAMDILANALPGVSLDTANIDYDKEFKTVDIIDAKGTHIVNGRIVTGNTPSSKNPPQIRTNFNETAFFLPQLLPDSTGTYTIAFTMPESLTRWKWMSLAHTKNLASGQNAQYIVTQKTLMVQPGTPRFLREGDALELTARISNTGDTALTGQAELQLIDLSTGNPVDGLFHNIFPNQYFTAEAGKTTVVKFPVEIPFNYTKPLTYRITASTQSFNDGEENTLPVLTNRMLVTESLPLYMKGDTTKHFSFAKLLNNNSETLQTQSLTVEYTANPVWNAIQALPYLMEYPYECAEQTFNRFYANALAAYIVQQHPRIKQVFDAWAKDTAALISNLEKNQELKQVLLEETPWVLDARNEAQQRKNLALLFDVVKMADGAQAALQKLQDMQMADGAFSWFKGGYANRYITQYIVTGIGRLQALHAVPGDDNAALKSIATNALRYLDDAANTDYKWLVKNKAALSKDNLTETAIQYLYMRSYFTGIPVADKTAYNYYYQQAMKYWQGRTGYMKGMISLALLRTGQAAFVQRNIYPSIIENAVTTAEKGMYWKNNQWGYYWYQSPVEEQALLIELAEALGKKNDAGEMRTWLINQKETNNWQTTKATADACFALVLHNNTATGANRNVTIQLGGYTISNNIAQAGTGYFKKVLPADSIAAGMGNITVTVATPAAKTKNTGPSYGAVYWQYFEDMDKITQAGTSFSLRKKLFVQRNSAAGTVLAPVDADSVLHVGDKVIIRIELTTDRNLEYVHLKDMRAATMEPVNVLSMYKWQDGLGYYESTKDVATDFFIDNISKGTYVFEYPAYITHTGTFSAGIATVQCMYAPGFNSHSEGVKVTVE